MACRNGTCHRQGRAYSYALGRRQTILCDDCHEKLTAIGMALRPIGPDDRPAWVLRSLSRDESRVAA